MSKRWLLLAMMIAAATVLAALDVGRTSTSFGQARAGTQRPVVPLGVQRLLKERAPLEAYVPTWLPREWHYNKYENLGRTGFDIYFSQAGGLPTLGLDAVRVPTLKACTQGAGSPTHRYRGVWVQAYRSHSGQMAWRCITHAGVHILLTVSAGPEIPRLDSLVRMDATLRQLGP
jgi:hypothetical protein